MTESSVINVTDAAHMARGASTQLARFTALQRRDALLAVASELEGSSQLIERANQVDLELAKSQLESGAMNSAMFNRLKLDAEKLKELIAGIRQVADLPDPLGTSTLARELDDGLTLHRQTCPIGVVMIIFESRPDALPQIVSLLIKTGNAGLIKGGKEARNSNEALFAAIMRALVSSGYPPEAFLLLANRDEVSQLLKLEGIIDLVIPRGSNELVRQIQESTRIPVLGHADGLCHLYIDATADLSKAQRITLDSKCQYPAACNASETLLIHRKIAAEFLPKITAALKEARVEIRCDADAIAEFHLQDVSVATERDWSTEYCDLILSVRVVNDIDEAISHINRYGSRHTDCIVTEDRDAFEKFATEVDSAGVYLNASTRFADGFRYGFGAEVGISTSKLHPRGPVGIDGLLTYKYRLVGDGHIVGDYSGPGGRAFKHKDLSP